VARILASIQEAVRTALARERLAELPRREGAAPQPSLGRLLFGREELPEAPPRAGEHARRSLRRALFAVEPLPRAGPRVAPRRSRWLSWLFAPERIDSG